MDPPFSGFVLDPSKCRKLSTEEKRELIRELSNWPESAPEKLQTWSRRDLLEILCAEMGKERKYTGVTKQKMIEHLFRIVSEKKSREHMDGIDSNLHPPPPPPNGQIPSKRQRKTNHPSRLPVASSNLLANNNNEAQKNIRYCLNLACRATLNQRDAFCKRCSCCICLKYDDNKDPSLWLVCSSETQSEGDPCGLSCHLECALKNERAGISDNGQCKRLDGSYNCVYCGKVNDLLRCWRKQLTIAKDARRVDVLCYRVYLSHKLLSLTEKYQNLHEIVDRALKKLESEVGPLNGLPTMARGLVNRLSVGAEVQKLCAHALQLLDTMLSSALTVYAQSHKAFPMSTDFIKSEDIAEAVLNDVTKSSVAEGTPPSMRCGSPKTDRCAPSNPWSKGDESNNTNAFGDLNDSPDSFLTYHDKPEILDSAKPSDRAYRKKIGTKNACIGTISAANAKEPEETPGHSGSALDEEPDSMIQTESHRDSVNSTEHNKAVDVPKSENESFTPTINEMMIVPYGIAESTEPVTPCRLETGKEGSGRSGKAKPVISLLENDHLNPEREPISSSKKRGGKKCEDHAKHGSSEGAYEYCVKVIRWLECEGYIETNFRVKFLTWFSLRATPQERRVVSAYVDTLIDDPTSLAGQLVDTFSEAVCSKRSPLMPTGFCMRLWH